MAEPCRGAGIVEWNESLQEMKRGGKSQRPVAGDESKKGRSEKGRSTGPFRAACCGRIFAKKS